MQKLLQSGVDRNSIIIALGGGVVGDLAGFVAARFCAASDMCKFQRRYSRK